MLIMFRAMNFASFKDEVILDMRATGFREHPSHTIPLKDYRLLKTLAIYGANASGKSNLISALYCFEKYVFNQLFKEQEEPLDEEDQSKSILSISMEPFALSNNDNKKIEMEIIFSVKDIIFQYGFSFEEKLVASEWLVIDGDEVFNREYNNISYGSKYKKQLIEYKKFRDDRLYLSVLDYFGTGQIKECIDAFKDFFENKFNVYFELFLESSVKGTGLSLGMTNKLIDDEKFRKQIVNYIRTIDVGITDLIVDVETIASKKTGIKKERKTIKAVHNVYDPNGIIVGERAFSLSKESSGTLRFLSFIQEASLLLENGGVFVVDELSARLHPVLTKFIIELFQSENNKRNAQLIFTTHDTTILNKEDLRRDEIAFVEKNERGESHYFTLADLKIRPDATYNKDYFSGKYGAIPIIQNSFIEEDGIF